MNHQRQTSPKIDAYDEFVLKPQSQMSMSRQAEVARQLREEKYKTELMAS